MNIDLFVIVRALTIIIINNNKNNSQVLSVQYKHTIEQHNNYSHKR